MAEDGGDGGLQVEVVQRIPADPATGRRGCVVLRPRGAVTAGTVTALTAGLERTIHQGANVVLDLSAVTALDPAGVAVLAGRSRRTHDGGGWLILTRPSPPVRAVLDSAAPRTRRAVRGLDRRTADPLGMSIDRSLG